MPQDVIVTINGANDRPVAVADNATVQFGHSITADAAHGVLANDHDPDIHDTLTVSGVNGRAFNVGHAISGAWGQLTLNADGSYSYVETASYIPRGGAQDVFNYTVSDGHGGTATSTLDIAVTHGLIIIPHYDAASVDHLSPTLRAEFKGAVQAAIQFYEQTFTNENVTLNITFGFERPTTSNGLPPMFKGTNEAQYLSGVPNEPTLDYYQLIHAFNGQSQLFAVDNIAYGSLPLNKDPTSGGQFDMTTAEAKALGLYLSTTNPDGSVWLNTALLKLNEYDFNLNDHTLNGPAVPTNQYDAVGIIEHEISEVMGRISELGQFGLFEPLDLFRYTSSNQLVVSSLGAAGNARLATLHRPGAGAVHI